MSQMTKQDKITPRDLSKRNIDNMPDREFKVMAIKILNGFEKRAEDFSETLNREIENKKQPIRDEELNN